MGRVAHQEAGRWQQDLVDPAVVVGSMPGRLADEKRARGARHVDHRPHTRGERVRADEHGQAPGLVQVAVAQTW